MLVNSGDIPIARECPGVSISGIKRTPAATSEINYKEKENNRKKNILC
jgi:hypothetical protein